ncbi:MAG: histone deacetylase [Bacillota bacterium]
MNLVYHADCLRHAPDAVPEGAFRLRAIMELLDKTGTLDSCRLHTPGPATVDALARVHQRDYLSGLELLDQQGGCYLTVDTAVTSGSYTAVRRAAGAAIQAVDLSLAGAGPAFALIRPPGHHAYPDRAMGYCLVNNVAVAAAHALAAGVGRVAVIDWDLHHGNGTETIFATDPRVLFISLHECPSWPGTGWLDEVGGGAGAGFTINIPLQPGSGDKEYLEAWRQIVAPAVRAHRPGLILVSAGQDGHFADYMGTLELTAAGYGHLAEAVATLAEEVSGGKLAAVLEGGYNPVGLAYSVLAIVRAWTGLPAVPEPLEGPKPKPDGWTQERLDAVKRRLASFWRFDA